MPLRSLCAVCKVRPAIRAARRSRCRVCLAAEGAVAASGPGSRAMEGPRT
jgi:hypothetical protein